MSDTVFPVTVRSVHISGTSGYDTGSGTARDPIMTWLEFIRRFGARPVFAHDVDIYLDENLTDALVIDFTILPTAKVRILGKRTVVATGTFSAVVARALASNLSVDVTDPNVSWAAHVGKLIVTGSGLSSFIAKDLGGHTARCFSFVTDQSASQFGTATEGSPVAGDFYTIYDVVDVGDALIQTHGPAVNEAGKGKFIVDGVSFNPSATGRSPTVHLACDMTGSFFNNCRFVRSTAIFGRVTSFNNCGFFAPSGGVTVSASAVNFYGGGSLVPVNIATGRAYFRLGFLLQSAMLLVYSTWSVALIDDMMSFDWTGEAARVQDGAHLNNFLNGWGGSSVVAGSYPIRIRGGYVSYQLAGSCAAKFPIVGQASYQFTINGTTSGPAYDPATNAFTAARNYTFALMDTPVVSGGFNGGTGGGAMNPSTGCSLYCQPNSP